MQRLAFEAKGVSTTSHQLLSAQFSQGNRAARCAGQKGSRIPRCGINPTYLPARRMHVPYMCVYTYMHTYVHVCTYVYISVHKCTLMYTCVHLCTLMYTCVHLCTLTFVHLCTLMYTYVHMCTLVHTYVHLCTHKCTQVCNSAICVHYVPLRVHK